MSESFSNEQEANEDKLFDNIGKDAKVETTEKTFIGKVITYIKGRWIIGDDSVNSSTIKDVKILDEDE